LSKRFSIAVVLLAFALSAYAEDTQNKQAEGTSSVAPATEAEVAPAAPKQKTKKRGKVRSEKEAEGTEAKDRFQADTVIKSQYQLDGETLEVDPD